MLFSTLITGSRKVPYKNFGGERKMEKHLKKKLEFDPYNVLPLEWKHEKES